MAFDVTSPTSKIIPVFATHSVPKHYNDINMFENNNPKLSDGSRIWYNVDNVHKI